MHSLSRPSTQAESSPKIIWPDGGPRILCFGNRAWNCGDTIAAWLLPIRRQWERAADTDPNAARPIIIHGDADGADKIAHAVAFQLGFEYKAYPIPREEWDRFGPRAGYMRNRRMAEESRPHLGIGFGAVQKESRNVGRSGSGHMLDILNELGIRVVMVAKPGDYPGVYQ